MAPILGYSCHSPPFHSFVLASLSLCLACCTLVLKATLLKSVPSSRLLWALEPRSPLIPSPWDAQIVSRDPVRPAPIQSSRVSVCALSVSRVSIYTLRVCQSPVVGSRDKGDYRGGNKTVLSVVNSVLLTYRGGNKTKGLFPSNCRRYKPD